MPAEVAPLRRKPVQQRSAQRVEKMLVACAELIDEVGYDGLTTTLIAERAGVAVGSLYQFFPDKRAVVQELTLRNLDRFVRTVSARFEQLELAHWWDAVDAVFDVYLTMHREVPAFSRLHFGDVVDLRLLDPGKDNNAVIAEKLIGLLAEEFGLDPQRLLLPLAVAVEAADAVLHMAFRRDPAGDPTLVAEAKEMVRGYLSNRIPEDQTPSAKPSAPL
ncbi:DNA-binding transcriptional regulator, AcrR family [Saccharopolyspora antimicrobica]|uniref:DNA-binding transcriptional regulator, AcrR family n=1 Tax=Saccharopolyspora antimicrobica TaxID=455193 RepID=A0A1I4X7F7_9PSEU|nr:TetR family transcriptional regulator [Saccharopolyspora antimicrobica]SFN21635.1 DNA-binding transcriptional regulator, AcrR family [Saccharopolyspora antimicrobica]